MLLKVKMSGPYKSSSTNMAHPSLYPSSAEIYAQQYTSQLSSQFERQISLTGNYFPFLDVTTRRSGIQSSNCAPSRQSSSAGDARTSMSHHTTPIPDYLLQPIYPWMKSKKGGKSEFGFGMSPFWEKLITFPFFGQPVRGSLARDLISSFAAGWKPAEQTNPSFPLVNGRTVDKWFKLQIMSDIFEILKLCSVRLLLRSIFSVSNRAEVWRVRCLLWWLMKFVFRISLLSEWVDSNERLNVDILSQHATQERVCKHLVDIVSRMKRFHWREGLFKFGTLHQLNNKGHHYNWSGIDFDHENKTWTLPK